METIQFPTLENILEFLEAVFSDYQLSCFNLYKNFSIDDQLNLETFDINH